jgi:hypothetical protein
MVTQTMKDVIALRTECKDQRRAISEKVRSGRDCRPIGPLEQRADVVVAQTHELLQAQAMIDGLRRENEDRTRESANQVEKSSLAHSDHSIRCFVLAHASRHAAAHS